MASTNVLRGLGAGLSTFGNAMYRLQLERERQKALDERDRRRMEAIAERQREQAEAVAERQEEARKAANEEYRRRFIMERPFAIPSPGTSALPGGIAGLPEDQIRLTPREWKDFTEQPSSGRTESLIPRVPIQLDDGQIAWVTGSDALRHQEGQKPDPVSILNLNRIGDIAFGEAEADKSGDVAFSGGTSVPPAVFGYEHFERPGQLGLLGARRGLSELASGGAGQQRLMSQSVQDSLAAAGFGAVNIPEATGIDFYDPERGVFRNKKIYGTFDVSDEEFLRAAGKVIREIGHETVAVESLRAGLKKFFPSLPEEKIDQLMPSLLDGYTQEELAAMPDPADAATEPPMSVKSQVYEALGSMPEGWRMTPGGWEALVGGEWRPIIFED